jgi:hypothetical protein
MGTVVCLTVLAGCASNTGVHSAGPDHPDPNFWWNWLPSFFTAVGTVGAVVVALFGESLRRQFMPPKLLMRLSTRSGEGEKAATVITRPVGAGGQLTQAQTISRWYHVHVENQRWVTVPATEVQVWWVELKVRNVAGTWNRQWIGELPIQWKDQAVKLPALKLGRADEADLCCVVKDGLGPGKHVLRLQPLFQKYPPRTEWDADCHITVKLEARSAETSSNVVSIEIHWDGGWDDDDVRMRDHLQIKQMT